MRADGDDAWRRIAAGEVFFGGFGEVSEDVVILRSGVAVFAGLAVGTDGASEEKNTTLPLVLFTRECIRISEKRRILIKQNKDRHVVDPITIFRLSRQQEEVWHVSFKQHKQFSVQMGWCEKASWSGAKFGRSFAETLQHSHLPHTKGANFADMNGLLNITLNDVLDSMFL